MSASKTAKAVKNLVRAGMTDRPDSEHGVISSVNGDGTYGVRAKGRLEMPSVPNITNFQGTLAVDDPVIVGYYERDKNKPFIVHRAPKADMNTTRFGSWPFRWGYRTAAKCSSFYDYQAFDLQNTKFDGYYVMTTPPSVDVVDGSWGFYASGTTLYRLDMTTSPISVSESVLSTATIVGVGEAYLYVVDLDPISGSSFLQAIDKGDLSVKFQADVTDATPGEIYLNDYWFGTFCAEGAKVSYLYLRLDGGDLQPVVRIFETDLSSYVELDPAINRHLGLNPSELWGGLEYGFAASGNPTPDPVPWTVVSSFPQVLTTAHYMFVCDAFQRDMIGAGNKRQPYGNVITCINRDTGAILWKIEGDYGTADLQWLKDDPQESEAPYDVWTPPIPDPPVAGTYNLQHYYHPIDRDHDYGTKKVFADYVAYRLICATDTYLFVERLTVTQATGLQVYVYHPDYVWGYTEDHTFDGSSWTIGPRTDILTDLNDSAPYSLRYLVETKLPAINIAYGSVSHGTIASEGDLPASGATWNFTGPNLDVDGSQPNCNLNTFGSNPQVDSRGEAADFAALQYLVAISRFESIHPPWKAQYSWDDGVINVWLGTQTSQTPTPVTTNERAMCLWDGQNGNLLWQKNPVAASWWHMALLIIGNYLFCRDPDASLTYRKFGLQTGTAYPPGYNSCALVNIDKSRIPTVAGKQFMDYNAGTVGTRRKQAT